MVNKRQIFAITVYILVDFKTFLHQSKPIRGYISLWLRANRIIMKLVFVNKILWVNQIGARGLSQTKVNSLKWKLEQWVWVIILCLITDGLIKLNFQLLMGERNKMRQDFLKSYLPMRKWACCSDFFMMPLLYRHFHFTKPI